jgi:hypothetical protein
MLKSVRSKIGLLVALGLFLMSNVCAAQEDPHSEEPVGDLIPLADVLSRGTEEPFYPEPPTMQMPAPMDPAQGAPYEEPFYPEPPTMQMPVPMDPAQGAPHEEPYYPEPPTMQMPVPMDPAQGAPHEVNSLMNRIEIMEKRMASLESRLARLEGSVKYRGRKGRKHMKRRGKRRNLGGKVRGRGLPEEDMMDTNGGIRSRGIDNLPPPVNPDPEPPALPAPYPNE